MSNDSKHPILVLLTSHWVSMLGAALVTTAGSLGCSSCRSSFAATPTTRISDKVEIASRLEFDPFLEVGSQCGAPRLESVVIIRPAFNLGIFYAHDQRAMQRHWDVS
jgi:hypothetical protein